MLQQGLICKNKYISIQLSTKQIPKNEIDIFFIRPRFKTKIYEKLYFLMLNMFNKWNIIIILEDCNDNKYKLGYCWSHCYGFNII